MGDRDAAELVRELESPDAERRAVAAFALMDTDTPEARAALIRALADSDPDVRGVAAQSVAMLGDVASLPRLVELLAADPGSEVGQVAWAVALLAESADLDDAGLAFAELLALGRRGAPEVAAQIALLLGEQPPPAPSKGSAERERVEAGLRAAFAGVTLGGGTSLRQAQAADAWGDGHTEAEWRALPQGEVTNDWSQVPEAELRRDGTSYLDEEGLRYYLPAFLIWLLDNYDRERLFGDEDGVAMALIGTMSVIAPGKDSRAERHAMFDRYTRDQRAGMAAYVEALPRLVNLGSQDTTRVERALRDYWGRLLPRL